MIDIENARALVETLKDYAEHPSSFTDISPTEADAAADLIDALLNEVERLNSPVVLSEWQKLVAERDALARDARELLAQMRHIRTHLYAATVQRAPTDDRIIADHVEQAYLRANEVIKSMEEACDKPSSAQTFGNDIWSGLVG